MRRIGRRGLVRGNVPLRVGFQAQPLALSASSFWIRCKPSATAPARVCLPTAMERDNQNSILEPHMVERGDRLLKVALCSPYMCQHTHRSCMHTYTINKCLKQPWKDGFNLTIGADCHGTETLGHSVSEMLADIYMVTRVSFLRGSCLFS